MLSAKNITKSYGSLQVLKGVNLDVKEKEIVSIVGPSGAGKSTLLHIIGSLDKPDSGSVDFSGKNLFTMKSRELAKFRNRYIGFVFQFHNLLPEFTALENVCIPGFLSGKGKKETEIKAGKLLGLLGLSERLKHKPSELSGGEQQRTAVARALINDPSVVLADEPSGNLDSANAEDLHQLFFRLRGELGCAFVIVTHNNELAGMTDRKLEMLDGKIISGN